MDRRRVATNQMKLPVNRGLFAQIWNLLYLRPAVGWVSASYQRAGNLEARQNAILRYGGFPICATTLRAARVTSRSVYGALVNRRILILFALVFLGLSVFAAEDAPLRVFIRASPKTHGPGAHDYPRFLEDWKKLLNARGAVADGALRPPTDAELAKTDVLLIYAADATNIGAEDRSRLESFLKRGGGLVALHDSICGTNTDWFAGLA